MSLRLLPAIVMDNDEDDDGNFTKWMSSYWGHGAQGGHTRDRKRSFRRAANTNADRRASLPSVSQLDAMKLNRLHADTMAKAKEEKKDVRPRLRARRASSDENSHPKSAMAENRITTIPELTESFEKILLLRNKKIHSLNDADSLCLICHEGMRNSSGGVHELRCTHRFHREAARRLEHVRPRSGSAAAACEIRRRSDERRKSSDEQLFQERDYDTSCSHLSLRRHR